MDLGSRINVTGNAGVGKSTLANLLSERLGFDVIALDGIVWQSGWRATPVDKCRAALAEIASRPTWIVDGVAKEIREAADTVIFLDYPRRISLWRCAKRTVRYLFRSRPELPENCPELLIIPTLVKLIMQFPRVMRQRILDEAQRPGNEQRYIHIRSQRELDHFLKQIGR